MNYKRLLSITLSGLMIISVPMYNHINNAAFTTGNVVYAADGLSSPLAGGLQKTGASAITNGYYCDYVASSGTPVYASCDGTVQFRQTYAVNYNKLASYANHFILTSADGQYTIKGAHLSSFNGVELQYTSSLTYPCGVSKYTCSTITLATRDVKKGELIGYTGMTGNASGPHLHLEVTKNGSAVDPLSVFSPEPEPQPNRVDQEVDSRYPKNIECTAPGRIDTYDVTGKREGNRYVDPGDQCIAIEAYTSGFWKINYPSGNTRREAYMKLSEWNPFPEPSTRIDQEVDSRYSKNVDCIAPDKIYTYDVNGNHEGNRYVDPGDQCIAIEAYTSGFWKINYPSGSDRREAYMKLSEWNPWGDVPPIDAKIKDISLSHVDQNGFRVEIELTNGNGVSSVKVPTWSHYADQDDIKWYDAKKYTETHWYADVKVAEHNDEYGTYAIHVYAYQANNTEICSSGINNDYGVFSVSFDANGGSVSKKSKSVTYKSKYGELPTPTRDGYTFSGWYTGKTDGTKITSDSTCNTWGNQTLYAHWTAKKYTLTFDANGGSVSSKSKEVTYKSKYGELPTPTRDGYAFSGWYSGKTDGAKITSESTYDKCENQTIYAHWTQNEYTITFNPNCEGVKANPETIKIKYNNTIGELQTLKREGYQFLGWFTDKTAGTQVNASTKITGNLTLYAHWKINQLTINFNTNGGAITNSEKYSADKDGIIYCDGKKFAPVWNYNTGDKENGLLNATTANLTKAGNVFLGWSVTPDSEKIFDQDDVTVTANDLYPDIVSKSGTVTLYARWKDVSKAFKGSGTEEDPYQISTKEDLETLRDYINNTLYNPTFSKSYYIQTADIDLKNESWIPIGTGISKNEAYDDGKTFFKGDYNGNGYKIDNLNVDGKANPKIVCSGLFGYFRDAHVYDLTVYGNVDTPSVNAAGGLVGEVQENTVIERCAFIGNVSGGMASEEKFYRGVGGLVGFGNNSLEISDCYCIGNVSSNSYAGGIIGTEYFEKSSEYEYKTVNFTIKNCYFANGVITGDEGAGAILGKLHREEGIKTKLKIVNCYAENNCEANVNESGADVDSSQLLRTSEMKDKAFCSDLGAAFVINENINEGYPVLSPSKPDPEPASFIVGDINQDGVVDITDLTLLSIHLVDKTPFTNTQEKAADVNHDGIVDLADLGTLRQFVSKVIDTLE